MQPVNSWAWLAMAHSPQKWKTRTTCSKKKSPRVRLVLTGSVVSTKRGVGPWQLLVLSVCKAQHGCRPRVLKGLEGQGPPSLLYWLFWGRDWKIRGLEYCRIQAKSAVNEAGHTMPPREPDGHSGAAVPAPIKVVCQRVPFPLLPSSFPGRGFVSPNQPWVFTGRVAWHSP